MSRPPTAELLRTAEKMMRPDWAEDQLPPDVRPRPTATTWVTREGWRVPVAEMSMGHVYNTVCMLSRQANKAIEKRIHKLESSAGSAYGYAGTAPDGAAMAAEGYADECFQEIFVLTHYREQAIAELCASQVACWGALVERLSGDEVDDENS